MALLEAKQLNRVVSDTLTLKDISFEISEKGTYGFIGKEDSGMGELAKLLAGITSADSGQLLYKDSEMFCTERETARIKRKIGYVSDKNFFSQDMTAFEVMDLVGNTKKVNSDKRFRQIKEAFDLTELSDKTNVLVKDLTMAERKRLSIASALLGNPDVIIMNDPLRMLDKNQMQNIKSLIEFLGEKKVILFFTSKPSEVEELCDHVAIVSHGEIALWDSVETVLKKLTENGFHGLADALEAFSDNIEKGE